MNAPIALAFVPAAPALAALLIAVHVVRSAAGAARLVTGAIALALVAAAVAAGADPLGGIVAVAVAVIALIVAGYAARSLDGSSIPEVRFFGLIAAATAGALTVAIASDLRLLALAWIATGLATSALLGIAATPAARRVARRHLALERIGDLAWVVILVVAWQRYGTFDLVAIGAAATVAPSLLLALALVVAGAIRSALVPLHDWLPNSMEAPTPVSAFMHAGLVNGAGVLLAKTAFIIVAAPFALGLAALLGGITAVVGAMVALVRPEVKRRLGWSTVAQMGFMVLQCGCGAFAAAVVHLIAHGGYKSAAFLGVGGTITAHAPVNARIERRTRLDPIVHAIAGIAPPTIGVLLAWALLSGRIVTLPAAGMTLAFAWATAVTAARGAAERATDTRMRIIVGAGIAFAVVGYLAIVIALDSWLGASLPHLTFAPAAFAATACALIAGTIAGLGLGLGRANGDALYAVALTEGRGTRAVPIA
jgi:NADH:ubiquinone oxidoreductase subunit 5 (subunit L)/multisubunit Na+/H+ antiporter MnhA subunit